ncbi:MAG: ABC transporter substrate-binding protein [Aphanothece sp. CMT-3BRIN-NPC111]|jgi:multiple sugar transport system substrate-binding protein|nr:ABC transporter substrate-binding protein [Aphanothece sp. CMT-3BRIN-NPC111]
MSFLQRLSWWLVLSICLLGLAGCQVWPGRSDDAGVIHLTLWQGINPPPNRDVFQSLVDRFNQTHPDIQVESLYVGQPDQQLPKILAAVVGNAPPNILWFSPMLSGQLVELGAIRALEDWLATSPGRSQIDPALFEAMEYQGHTWSVPLGTNNVGIFYRPSLFKAAGITQLPKTWEELRQVARKLTGDINGDGRIDRHGMLLPLGKGEWTVFNWLPFMWSGGGELTNSRTDAIAENVNLVNEGAIAALQLWRNLIEDGSAVLSLPERGYELDKFLAGKVAMQLTGPWTLGQLVATGVDFDVFPIPANVRSATAMGGENLFILKTTPEHERAAFTFVEYVLSEEFQTQWALGTGYLPVNLKARQSAAYQNFVAKLPVVKVFLEQTHVARSRPIFLGYNRISENLGRAIEAVLLGKSSPVEALKAAQKRLDLIFQ